ncbi:MAG: carbohydrate ABC transporter permease, partial [Chloroflexi bacterium]
MSVLVASPRPATRWRPSTAVAYLLLIALAVFYLLPMFAIVVTSLKSFNEVSRSTLWELPKAPTFEAFGSAFDVLAPSFFNSVLLVVPATVLSALLGSLNGYVLSK